MQKCRLNKNCYGKHEWKCGKYAIRRQTNANVKMTYDLYPLNCEYYLAEISGRYAIRRQTNANLKNDL
jgi:hypothetical protein